MNASNFRNDWIAAARQQFVPSERKECLICGQFKSITQAHHIRPLAMQSYAGGLPDHAHAWLCPSHHVAVHILLGQAVSVGGKASKACIDVVSDLSEPPGHLESVLEIVRGAFQ